jgi:hypothetical protein
MIGHKLPNKTKNVTVAELNLFHQTTPHSYSTRLCITKKTEKKKNLYRAAELSS